MTGKILRNSANVHDQDTGELVGYVNPITGREVAAPPLTAEAAAAVEAALSASPMATSVGVREFRQQNRRPPFIRRVTADSYTLGWMLDSFSWVNVSVQSFVVGAYTTHEIKDVDVGVYTAWTLVQETDASVTYSGDTWATTAAAETSGGSWKRSSVTGAKYTITTPVCRNIEIESYRTTNMGYARVTVDGSPALANCLPTAAQEVDAGFMASSALAANGGPLQADDRVIRFYSSTGLPTARIAIAAALQNAAHVVVVECVGVKPAASSDFRIGISAYRHGSALLGPVDGAELCVQRKLSPWPWIESAFEYAYVAKINGVSTFVGNVHGYETSALAVTRYGQTITMVDGQTIVAPGLALVKTSSFYHPESLATAIGTAEITYSPGQSGLECAVRLNFTASGGELLTGYVGMLPVPNHMASALFVQDGQTLVVGGSADNGTNHYAGDSFAALLDGVGIVHDSPEVTFQGGRYAGALQRSWFEDRSGGGMNKMYFTTNQTATPQAMPARIESVFRYIVW